MRRFGFSTGALAKGDFGKALEMLRGKNAAVIELSALREEELPALLDRLNDLELSQFQYVSLHAPSSIRSGSELKIALQLRVAVHRGWPIIVHPDIICDFGIWRDFGAQLCVENMDARKPTGRSANELTRIFAALPAASFCCDLGHARQVDPTMAEATEILKRFGSRLKQLHMSEVNAKSTHDRLSLASVSAFSKIFHLIPDDVPVVLETPVSPSEIETELAHAREALPPRQTGLLSRAV